MYPHAGLICAVKADHKVICKVMFTALFATEWFNLNLRLHPWIARAPTVIIAIKNQDEMITRRQVLVSTPLFSLISYMNASSH